MKVKILNYNRSELEISVDGEKMLSKCRSHSSREVFKFKNFVVKIADKFSQQNRNEIDFYKRVLEKKDVKFFPKLITHGTFGEKTFLVQEKVHDRVRYAKPHHVAQFQILQKKYNLADVDVAEDYLLWNAAISGGELKIYDIGFRQHQWGGRLKSIKGRLKRLWQNL